MEKETVRCKNCGEIVPVEVMIKEMKCPSCLVAVKCYRCRGKNCEGKKYLYDYQGPPCPKGHNDWEWGC